MEKMPWHVAYEIIEPFVVKIITPQGSGTGFLGASTDSQSLIGIATAAHVIDFSHYWKQPLRIQHAKSGETIFLNHDVRYIEIDYQRDIASIVIPGNSLPFPKNKLRIITEETHLKVGEEVAWMGFPAIAPNNLCFFSGNISSWVEDAGFYFVDGVAINGVSGGPAFSIYEGKEVQLIGVVSAYIPNRATGIALPGLCVVRDIMPLYKTVRSFKSFEEAKKQEKAPETPPPSPSPSPSAIPSPSSSPSAGEPTKF